MSPEPNNAQTKGRVAALEEALLEQAQVLASLTGKLEGIDSKIDDVNDSIRTHKAALEKYVLEGGNTGKFGAFQKAIIGAILVQSLFHGITTTEVAKTALEHIFHNGGTP